MRIEETTAFTRLTLALQPLYTADQAAALLHAFSVAVEREVRAEIAADIRFVGKQRDTLSWGEAHLIASEGLCACRGGRKPCQDAGGAR
ncbi:hypothetical protein [Streptomyces sp. NPDC057910]|uniref:hypothetical protein n=1 Tax=Streptomyces sp. NPDC057910 TaxID=3346278 RepID=UPI001E0F606D|nr:hypothetical protein [Streptomyces sp. MAG02]